MHRLNRTIPATVVLVTMAVMVLTLSCATALAGPSGLGLQAPVYTSFPGGVTAGGHSGMAVDFFHLASPQLLPDVIVPNGANGNSLTMFTNNGAWSFTATTITSSKLAFGSGAGKGTPAIVSADFDQLGPNYPGLLVTNQGDDSVAVLVGQGDGTFSSAPATVAVGPAPTSIDTGDLDGDGFGGDFVTADSGSKTVSIRFSNQNGTYSAPGIAPPTLASEPQCVKVADFNGDGWDDIAASLPASNAVDILLSNHNGTFTRAGGSPFATGSWPTRLAVGDFNGDGKADVMTLNTAAASDAQLTVMIGDGAGVLASLYSTATGNVPSTVLPGDIGLETMQDPTGQPPLAAYEDAVTPATQAVVHLNQWSASLTPEFAVPPVSAAFPSGSPATALGLAQIDPTDPNSAFAIIMAGDSKLTVIKTSNLPPTTGAVFDPTSAENHWVSTDVTVTLDATQPAGPGVANTYYAENGGFANIYTLPLKFTAEGMTTLTYWSVDASGFAETTQTAFVRIDKSAPSQSFTGQPATIPPAAFGWSNQLVPLTINASDSLSGVYSTRYTINGSVSATYSVPLQFPTADYVGTQTVDASTVDNAGNRCATQTVQFGLDTTVPVTTLTTYGVAPTGWINAASAPGGYHLSRTDDHLAPMSTTVWEYINGVGPFIFYNVHMAYFDISTQGTTTVSYQTTDAAGNIEATQSATLQMDTLAPTTVIEGIPGSPTTLPVDFGLHATDPTPGSGLSGVYYLLDSDPTTQTYTTTVTVNSLGTHTVRYWAEDVAGNVESSQTATFTIETPHTHTVTFIAGANGSVEGALTQVVDFGGSTTPVTATPNAHYSFVDWTGSGFTTSTANPLTLTNVTADVTITANFAPITHRVVFVSGSNGSVEGSLTQTVMDGASATPVTATPNAHYSFVDWTQGGVTTSTANPLTLTNVTADVTITANFAPIMHTVKFVSGANGSVVGSLTQTVMDGASATPVTATPDPHYRFVDWTDGGVTTSTANPLTLANVTADVTLTANFAVITHRVAFLAGANGSVDGSLTQTIVDGNSSTPVTATPNTNYVFVNWTGTGFTTSTANPLTIANVTADVTVTASFATTHSVTFVAGANGSVVGSLTQTVIDGGSSTAVTATPNSHYKFVNWTGSGFTTSTSNPLTVTNVTADVTITANFDILTHRVVFVAGANGSVVGSLTQTIVDGNSSTPVTATANTHYRFVNWTGPGFATTTSNPLTIANVTADVTVTANFTPITHTVTFLAGANGTLQGTTVQTVVEGGSSAPVQAIPNTHYKFVNWTGAGFTTSADNPLSVTNVLADITVTANFDQLTHTVTFVAGPNGSIVGATTQTVVDGASSTPVTATPNAHYRFVNWTGTGFTTSTANPLTVTTVTADVTITANFGLGNHTVTFLAGANGSVVGSLTQTVADGGSASPVTATPNAHYRFVNWTGTGFTTSTANPLTVTNVTADVTITANFSPITHRVVFLAGANGSVVGSSTQTVVDGDAATPVTALPNAFYAFVNWTGSGLTTSTANPLTVTNVTADVTATANFAAVAPTTQISALPPGWVNHDVQFSLTATGTPPLQTFYGLNAPAITPYSTPVTVSAEGTTTILYRSTGTGGTEPTNTATVRIDKIAPVASSDATANYIQSATIMVSAHDALSGIASIWYAIDGAAPATYTTPVVIGHTGAYTFAFGAVDNAGNRSATQTVDLTVHAGEQVFGAPDRYESAVKASRSVFPTGSVGTVVIATGQNFPDALSAGPLAGAYAGPVLLTRGDALPSTVSQEITRLGATRAIIVGGTGVVLPAVQNQLAVLLGGATHVSRLGASTRYGTAALVAEGIKSRLSTTGRTLDGTVFIATGTNYPDALSGGADGWAKWRPILLVKGAQIPKETSDALAGLRSTRAVILGGTGVIPVGTANTIKSMLTGPKTIVRLAGLTRYDTAAAVADWATTGEGLNWATLGIATGQNFPDALAGGPVMGKAGGVLLLTTPTVLSPATGTAVTANASAIQLVKFFGGDAAVAPSVRASVMNLLP